MLLKINLVPLCFIILFCSKSFSQDLPVKTVDINYLVNMLEGSYSSNLHSENDSGYLSIEMHIKKIWGDRADGKWLYTEQAVLMEPDKPYRQRVYRITQSGDRTFESDVFTFNEPLRFAGDWTKEDPLGELIPDSLTLQEGCTIYLSFTDENTFEGSTRYDNCPCDFPGAKYLTSEVKITTEAILFRDMCYDANGLQVRGAEREGMFLKK